MILIISVCQEKIHEFEFVRPIESVLKEKNLPFLTKHYKSQLSRSQSGESSIFQLSPILFHVHVAVQHMY